MVRFRYQGRAGIFPLTEQHNKNIARRHTGLKIIYLESTMGSIEKYRGDDKSLARPTSRCILFAG
jgi:hypothetical protein